MSNTTTSDEKWVLYLSGFGPTVAVGCENTPEELMTKAGIGQPVKWTDQGGRYIGIPFDGEFPAKFYYTINQDGETIYKVMTGQRPERQPRKSAFGEAFGALARFVSKVTR